MLSHVSICLIDTNETSRSVCLNVSPPFRGETLRQAGQARCNERGDRAAMQSAAAQRSPWQAAMQPMQTSARHPGPHPSWVLPRGGDNAGSFRRDLELLHQPPKGVPVPLPVGGKLLHIVAQLLARRIGRHAPPMPTTSPGPSCRTWCCTLARSAALAPVHLVGAADPLPGLHRVGADLASRSTCW
jgi:hypothetical protein